MGGRLDPASVLPPSRIRFRAPERHFRVDYGVDAGGRARVTETRNGLRVLTPVLDENLQRQALRRWLRERARREVLPHFEQLCRETGLRPKSVQFRLQRTRWGSCSSRRTISLNACMVFLPAELARYLMIHELCHLRHLDHSPRYWRLVARHEPECRELDRRLDGGWTDVPAWTLLD
jgi:hypothetical protein